jgi:cytokinesis protein
MDTIFRKHRTRSSASTSSTPHAQSTSPTQVAGIPYSQIPATHPAPVAVHSPSTFSFSGNRNNASGITVNDVGAPSTNPSLSSNGTMFNIHARSTTIPPPSPHGSTNRTSAGSDIRRLDAHSFSPSNASHMESSASEILYHNALQPRPPSREHQYQLAEFGGSRHPYAAGRDADAASIRTVSSFNSTVNSSKRDLGRYPSFEPSDPRGSVSSRSGHTLVTPRAPGPSNYSPSVSSFPSNLVGSRLSEEFVFTRPSDEKVNELFQQLIANRNVDEHSISAPLASRQSAASQASVAQTAANLPVDIKWQMVESDARSRYDAAKQTRRKEEELLRSGKAGKRGTANAVVKNSPEWFLKKVLDGTITTQHITTLTVSLRTQPYE